ncbi:MAG: hypothetical protein Kow0096_10180 [Thiohalomonadaceae bacterium]
MQPRQAYVLGCYRYIELNPVRATMVEHPRDYPWSSYRANGEGLSDPLLTPHSDYLRLGSTAEVRRENYRALFITAHIEPELLAEIRHATNGNFTLGSQRFKDEVAQMLGRRVVPGRSGRPRSGDGGLKTVVCP